MSEDRAPREVEPRQVRAAQVDARRVDAVERSGPTVRVQAQFSARAEAAQPSGDVLQDRRVRPGLGEQAADHVQCLPPLALLVDRAHGDARPGGDRLVLRQAALEEPEGRVPFRPLDFVRAMVSNAEAEVARAGQPLPTSPGAPKGALPMKSIVVAGDLVRDHYLYQSPTTPSSYHEPSPATVLREEPGGPWYLSELVKVTCDDRKPEVWVPPDDPAAGRSFSILSKYPRRTSGGKKETVWRIATFLGCERPKTLAPPGPTAPIQQTGPEAPGDGEVLLIDDLGLGFNRSEALWPAPLKKKTWPGRVVLKTSSAPGENLLLKDLLGDALSDRLTVVVSAGVLRPGAVISQGLSWDQTIEQTRSEFAEGLSSQDMARCRRVVVWFGMSGVASFAGWPDQDKRRFGLERFLYRPEELEGDWEKQRPGLTFGVGSFLAAALTRHEIDRASFPLYLALEISLRAARVNHEEGFATDHPGPLREAVREILKSRRCGDASETKKDEFFTAFPHDLLSVGSPGGQPVGRSDLLSDLTGTGLEYVTAKATEVVLHGTEEALRPAPKARYGSFITVDREEIERINAIRRLAEIYLSNPDDRRPLSVAVFGPPGSGKSFAIKQLAEVLFGEKREALTFNLSEFGDQGLPLLHEAFHRVRDASVQGRVPLVFWDEFDSNGLEWLKHFLAPMQDAEFRAGSLVYPIGRALFVFAGGTKSSFREFDLSNSGDPGFVAKKGPDFVSRLRGFIDIKGPNPTGGDPRNDPPHLIRRAVLLRSLLERNYPDLIDARTGQAGVSPGVVRGFLRVERYQHGARSLEFLVHASRLLAAQHFGPSQLPPPDLLSLYVSPDFLKQVTEGELDLQVIEALAEAQHRAWRKLREDQGWTYGPIRDDTKKIHDRLVNYDELSEAHKEANRSTARLVIAKLHQVGYAIRRRAPDGTTPSFPEVVRKDLADRARYLDERPPAPRVRIRRDDGRVAAPPPCGHRLREFVGGGSRAGRRERRRHPGGSLEEGIYARQCQHAGRSVAGVTPAGGAEAAVRVYLSSTYEDLRPHRAAVARARRKSGSASAGRLVACSSPARLLRAVVTSGWSGP